MSPSSSQIKEMIFFFRVHQWLHVLGLVLLGHVYAHPGQMRVFSLTFSLLIGFFYLAHGYSLNDISDNQLKIPIEKTRAMKLSLSALLLSIMGSVLISLPALAVVLGGHLCGMIYSMPPLRLKNKLALDLVFNAFSFVPLFLLGIATEKPIEFMDMIAAGIVFFYFLPVQLMHEIQDNTLDLSMGQKNTFQILGIKKTVHLTILTLLGLALFSYMGWRLNLWPRSTVMASLLFAFLLIAVLTVPRFLRLFKQADIFRNIKILTRFISIFYGIALFFSFYFNI